MDTKTIGFAATAWATLAGYPAVALDFCITCTAPDAHYLCRMDSPSGNPRDLRLQLLCISQLAEIGSHASCSIDNPRPQTCNGVLRVVEAPEDLTAPPATAARPSPEPAPQPTESATETVVTKDVTAPKSPPQAADAAPSKGGGVLDKTGRAISQAAKKTWNCLSTLFGDC